MSATTVELLGVAGGGETLGGRIAVWLHDRGYSAKGLARELGCEPRTAKAWLAGQPPINRHLVQMVDLWGAAFLEYAFAPWLAESDLSVSRRLLRLEAEITALKGVIDAPATAGPDDRAPAGAVGDTAGRAAGGAGAAAARSGAARALIWLLVVAAVVALAANDDAQARQVRRPRDPVPVVRLLRGPREA